MTNGGYNLVLQCDCKKCRAGRAADETSTGIDAVYIADGADCREAAFKKAREDGWRFTRGRQFCYKTGHRRDTLNEQEILTHLIDDGAPDVVAPTEEITE